MQANVGDLRLKYLRLTPSGCNNIGIGKFKFVAKTQFPSRSNNVLLKYLNNIFIRSCINMSMSILSHYSPGDNNSILAQLKYKTTILFLKWYQRKLVIVHRDLLGRHFACMETPPLKVLTISAQCYRHKKQVKTWEFISWHILKT